MSRRIGFFGGSFDPPHNGHLAIAAATADRLRLERVLFVPTGKQPLKPGGASASFVHRLRMTELACMADPRFTASPLDAPHANGCANFTVDALQNLQSELPPEDSLVVLVGVDAFRDLRRWKEPLLLLELGEWAVISRPSQPSAASLFAELQLTRNQIARVHAVEGLAFPESSTAIRERLANGDDCRELLPGGVLRYIQEHHLYSASPTGAPN